MMPFFFLLLSIALCANLHSDSFYRKIFDSFIIRYGKNYISSEREYRMRVLAYNMDWSEQFNSKNHSFSVGASPFADMTNSEFSNSRLCGCMLQSNHSNVVTLSSHKWNVDWRQEGAVTSIKNQESCGACWAFSAAGALEGLNYLATGNLMSLSVQQLIDCDEMSNGCNGGSMENAFEYVIRKGLCSEIVYPYHAKNEYCKDSQCDREVYIRGYADVPENNGIALKAAISKTPVSVALEADTSLFQLYTGGIIDSYLCGIHLNHGVLAVGYTEDYIIVKNSWGKMWGEMGYVRIMHVDQGEGYCGINMAASYPVY